MGRFTRKQKEKEKYSNISEEELEKIKNRAIEIKEEISILCKSVKLENVKKVSELTKEFQYITKELEKYKNQQLSTQQLASKLAKFFAAKEAFVKALGTGFRFGINLKDIQILSNELGKPYIKIIGTTQNYIEKNIKNYNTLKYHLSLSDDYPNGIAFVVIEN